MSKYDVFISYSRKDTPVADKICTVFDRKGISYFIDRQGISGGMEFPAVLAEAIMESKLFLFLASANSYESKFTNSEITFAFNEKPKNSLLPYIIDNSSLPIAIKFIFSGINWRNITDHPIDTVLVNDICRLLGRECQSAESAEDLYKRGKEYFDKENFGPAIPLLTRASEMGYAPAYVPLWIIYSRDYGAGKVFKNDKEALKWLHKAYESETRETDKKYLGDSLKKLETKILIDETLNQLTRL